MVLRGSVYSNTLGMETGLSVITPNDYGQAKRYRVCYVLHGLCGGNADFSNYTMLPYFAYDKDILFLCPEVQRSFYTDTDYGMAYFRYVCRELPHLAKLVFNISAEREDTAVIGCSMGGYGALKCALTAPETFGVCGALAPGCLFLKEYLEECRQKKEIDFPDFYGIFGKDLTYQPENDIIYLSQQLAADPKREKPRLFISVGEQDWLLPDNRRFADFLRPLPFDLQYEEIPGEHDFYAFNEGIKRFISWWK